MSSLKVSFVNLGLQYEKFRSIFTEAFDRISGSGAHILASENERFEKNFSEYCGTKFALGVANGTDAIFLILKALNIGSGDEVITVPNSFLATAGAIIMIGAKPVFVDVGDDFNMDPKALAKAFTRKTKAILPVHLTGMPVDMDPILFLGEKHGVPVIEDCAQAVGALYHGRRVGALGIAGAFSLHPLKNLHVHGDGGAISTNDEKLYLYIKQLRNHGLRNRDECDFWGLNSRLDEIQAAIANVKLEHLDAINERCREIAMRYHSGLKSVVQVPKLPSDHVSVFHNFVIQTEQRSELQSFLLEKGVETKIHYPIPIHLQRAAESLGYRKGDFPVTEHQASRILSLPIYPELTNEQADYVISSIRSFRDRM